MPDLSHKPPETQFDSLLSRLSRRGIQASHWGFLLSLRLKHDTVCLDLCHSRSSQACTSGSLHRLSLLQLQHVIHPQREHDRDSVKLFLALPVSV